jgi:hypothetical protein
LFARFKSGAGDMTGIELLQQARQRGLTLSRIDNDLHVTPAHLCPPNFSDRLRDNKPELLRLVSLTFLTVQSEVLGEIVFFVPDDETRAKLIAAGAEPGSVYTHSELALLVKCRVSADELRRIHKAKQYFEGMVTPGTANGGELNIKTLHAEGSIL